jgi:hypothetical protein
MRFARLALVGLALPALLTVAVVDPNEPGHYPQCPFKLLTGLDCPGCGSLRALHDLSHGDLLGALDHNAVLGMALPIVLVSAALWVMGRQGLHMLRHRYAGWVVLAVAVGWGVLRNVPYPPLEVLAS